MALLRQCIINVYGGDVKYAGEILHGKTSPLRHDNKGVNADVPQDVPVTRYHSLAGTYATLPDCLEVTSWAANEDGSRGVIMGVRHRELTVEGVQFHPESILSAGGRPMIKNFLHMRGGTWEENARLQKAAAANGVGGGKQPAKSGSDNTKKNNILQQIYAHRRAAVAAQKEVPSQRPADLQAAYDLHTAPPQISLAQRLRQTPFRASLMAEIKRASPSKGVFALDMDAAAQARRYALAGASVISVLTEPEWFRGGLEDLRAVRRVLEGMPNRPAVLRKEFVFDEYQILEARLAGADAVLLIVKMLDQPQLDRLYAYSLSLGMEPLVEVQNAAEMAVAVQLGARVVGVNNRNLESFEVDLSTTGRLRGMVPSDVQLAALSGINTHADVLACVSDGVSAILVGEAIMRAPDAGAFIRQLCAGEATPQVAPKPDRLLVKICGTRTPEAALAAMQAGADLVGMILVPGSRRCVTPDAALAISRAVHSFAAAAEPDADADAAATTASSTFFSSSTATDYFAHSASRISAPGRPKLVGVFADAPLDEVLRQQRRLGLDVVQLHGTREPVEWARLVPCPVVQVFKPGAAKLTGMGVRAHHAAVLLDSGAGSGKTLDAAWVADALRRDPGLHVMLAGGLTAENVADVLRALGDELGSRVIGVDTSSGVEVDGKQDPERIAAFVKAGKSFR